MSNTNTDDLAASARENIDQLRKIIDEIDQLAPSIRDGVAHRIYRMTVDIKEYVSGVRSMLGGDVEVSQR